MKTSNNIVTYSLLAAVLIGTCLFSSCYTPSPLYGTWADNTGDKITFISDGTFTATITNTAGSSTLYGGTWTVLDNVLIFTKSSGSTVDTEWDIRGSMLYLDWVDDYNETQALTLYHVSK
jgi:hypothetical protein